MSDDVSFALLAVFGVAVRVLLAVVFAQGLNHKLRETVRFRAQLQRFDVLPLSLVTPASFAVTVAEAAVLLCLAAVPEIGLPVAATLLVTYALAMAINVRRGRRDIDCGCGGVPLKISWELVGRNFFLAGLALLALTAPRPSLLPIAIGAIAGFVCVLFYLTLHEFAANAEDAPA